jgi:hypothetical protein
MEKKWLDEEQLKVKRRLLSIFEKVYKIAETLPVFNFDDFERLLINKSGKIQMDVNYYYENTSVSLKNINAL